MTPEELANKNYDAVLAEKRDKLNSRLQIWSLLLALISGFGVASVQEGNTSLVVALYPLLAACLAHFAAHSEAILDQIKAYLLQLEQEAGINGYETHNKQNKLKSSSSGGHKKALLQALTLTQTLATSMVVWRLHSQGNDIAAAIVLCIEILAIITTVQALWEAKPKQPKTQPA